jgi:Protease inhibitor Inh
MQLFKSDHGWTILAPEIRCLRRTPRSPEGPSDAISDEVRMNRKTLALAATLCSVLALGACSSSRFGPGSVQASAASPMESYPEPIEAVPTGPVTGEPLPPLDGPGAVGPIGSAPLPGDVTSPGIGNDIAALPPASQQPVTPVMPSVPTPTGRSALVGGWTAKDASGASCRVQLSSAPALDLYRASAGSCGNKDLSRVTAWDYRDGEVYLYQPGGTVAARLRGGPGSLSGVIAKSGAPLTLSK